MVFGGAKTTEKVIGTRWKYSMIKENTYDEIIFEQIGFGFYWTINSILPFRLRKGINSPLWLAWRGQAATGRWTNPPETVCR